MASIQPHSSFSLLIVEDDETARDVIARMVALKYRDCTISTAGNGKMGLELFKEQTPDIIITDINMPEMDGIEMARQIKSIKDNATCIVLTAHRDKAFFDQFAEIGFCAYLMKPINFQELFAVIEKCSAEMKLQQECF